MTVQVKLASPPVELTPVRTLAADDRRALVRLSGELDVSLAKEIEAVLNEHLDEGRRLLRVDMSSVTFIDTSVIGVFVDTHARAVEQHGALMLTGVLPAVERLIRLCGVGNFLIFQSDAAVRAAQSTIRSAELRTLPA